MTSSHPTTTPSAVEGSHTAAPRKPRTGLWILIGLLALALIGLGAWGLTRNQGKRTDVTDVVALIPAGSSWSMPEKKVTYVEEGGKAHAEVPLQWNGQGEKTEPALNVSFIDASGEVYKCGPSVPAAWSKPNATQVVKVACAATIPAGTTIARASVR